MSILAAIPAIIASVALGFGLGCTPVVQDHLHWSLFWTVPISGLIYGLIVGYGSFALLKLLQCQATSVVVGVLVLSAGVGFASVDFGTYLTVVDEINGREVRIADHIDFRTYMKEGRGLDSIWGLIQYVVDLILTMGAAYGAIAVGVEENPYCEPCRRYRQKDNNYDVTVAGDEELARKLLAELKLIIEDEDYGEFREFCRDLSQQGTMEEGESFFKITFDERRCVACESRTLRGTFEFPDDDGDLVENSDYAFSMTSAANFRTEEPKE